jgi:hypothetical protein
MGHVDIQLLNYGTDAIGGSRPMDGISYPVGFAACRADRKPAHDPQQSGRYWIGIDGHQKLEDGRYKVLATFLNIDGQDLTFDADARMSLDGQGKELVSTNGKQPNGEIFHEWPRLAPCQSTQVAFIFEKIPSGVQKLSFRSVFGSPASWDIASDFSRPPPGQGTGPSTPTPTLPPPPPAPPPSSPPPPAGGTQTPTPGPAGGSTSSGWQRYGIWSFKVDELGQGPDGHWQMVASVRSESRDKVGLNAAEIDAYLINADGEMLPEAGNLYKASVTGTAAGLEKLSGTQWMQQGDIVRVRLLFEGSAKVNPVTLRVKSCGGSPTTRNFPVGAGGGGALARGGGGGSSSGASLGDAAETIRQAAEGAGKAKKLFKAAKGLFR